MRRFSVVAAAVFLALPLVYVATPAGAAEPIKPGRWEFSSQMQAPAGMPQLPPGMQSQAGGERRPSGGMPGGGMPGGGMPGGGMPGGGMPGGGMPGGGMPGGGMPGGGMPGGGMPGGGMPGGGMNVSHTSCIDPDRAVPTDPRPECRIDRMQRNGGTVNWATICTTRQGAVQSEGIAHYAGDTMQATLTTHIPQPGGQTMNTTQRITGRYLGACQPSR